MAKRLGTRAFTVSFGDARYVAKTSQGVPLLIESDPSCSEFAELLEDPMYTAHVFKQADRFIAVFQTTEGEISADVTDMSDSATVGALLNAIQIWSPMEAERASRTALVVGQAVEHLKTTTDLPSVQVLSELPKLRDFVDG